jgi:hypothetical protein
MRVEIVHDQSDPMSLRIHSGDLVEKERPLGFRPTRGETHQTKPTERFDGQEDRTHTVSYVLVIVAGGARPGAAGWGTRVSPISCHGDSSMQMTG